MNINIIIIISDVCMQDPSVLIYLAFKGLACLFFRVRIKNNHINSLLSLFKNFKISLKCVCFTKRYYNRMDRGTKQHSKWEYSSHH